jgi:hypothetical protein
MELGTNLLLIALWCERLICDDGTHGIEVATAATIAAGF